MSLASGTKLGPYEIQSLLGAGGMGEVYRARDTRLHRDVAVKVLPAGLESDPDGRARFEREARAVAALNHPNILALHDIGHLRAEGASASQGEVTYLVTELLDGETLRDRLRSGPVPVRKAVDLAAQIARGLAAAHDKGIVHRDLKPENVFVLKDGHVKILDFGIARLTIAAGDQAETASAMTDPGTVLGTAGYMAPEQVRGQAVDTRTDLFALGAVLYEMLSGKRAFRRDTAADTMAAILNEDPPDLTAARSDLPPTLERIVRHCLEKAPTERFQSARDVAFALEAMSTAHPAAGPSTRDAPRWRVPAYALIAVALLAAGAGIYRLWMGGRPPVTQQTGLNFERKTWDPMWITNARYAPDGKTIVYSAALTGGTTQLFVIRPGSVASEPLGAPGTHLLSISSKNTLAVLTEATALQHRLFRGTLARMTMEGAVRPLADNVREADWGPDGESLAVIRPDKGLDTLEYPTGSALHQTTGYLSDPRVSPDGSRVAFFEHSAFPDNRGWVKVVERGKPARTLTPEFYAVEGLAWVPGDDAVVFSASAMGSGQQLMPYRVNATGTPEVRQVLPAAQWTFVHDVAADGRMLLTQEDLRVSIRAQLPGESSEREYAWLEWAAIGILSRDGKWMVFSDQSQDAGPNYQVAMRKTNGSIPVRLGEGTILAYSPDGKWALGMIGSEKLVAYSTGAEPAIQLDRGTVTSFAYYSVNWFRDGRRFLLCGSEPSRPPRCYLHSLDGGKPVAVTDEGVRSIRLAPDDKTVLLLMAEDGSYRLDTLGERHPRPVLGLKPGDQMLDWSRDGLAVFVHQGTVPNPVERVELATGRRTLVKRLMPDNAAGVIAIYPRFWPEDGTRYTYSYMRDLSRLFVASGANLTGR